MNLKTEVPKQRVDSFLIVADGTIKQAMKQMSAIGEKELFVVNGENKLIGSLSDGDVRRWILKEGSLKEKVDRICNKDPKTVGESYEIESVKEVMLEQKIESIPVITTNNEVKDVLLWDDVFAGKIRKHREEIDVPVVIMAGGKGARLDPFTKILPKSLIPIGDKPIIEIIMDKFSEYGMKDFYVSVNHKAKMIKSYFEETNGKFNITYIEEEKPLGTAGSLKLLEKTCTNILVILVICCWSGFCRAT